MVHTHTLKKTWMHQVQIIYHSQSYSYSHDMHIVNASYTFVSVDHMIIISSTRIARSVDIN